MLPSYQQIWPIFATWHFVLYEAINIAFNMVFNIINVYFTRRHQKPPFKFIDVTFLWTVTFYTVLVALFMFVFSFDIHKRIREEKAHPVARAALRNTRFKRIFFWGICERNWKKRLPKFIVCCIVCCAIPVTLFFWCLCILVCGPSAKTPCTASSLWHLIGYDAWWKAMCTFVIVAVNYVACHNDEAPEVQPRESKGADDAEDDEHLEEEREGSVFAVSSQDSFCSVEHHVRREGKGMLQEESSSLLACAAPPPVRYDSNNHHETVCVDVETHLPVAVPDEESILRGRQAPQTTSDENEDELDLSAVITVSSRSTCTLSVASLLSSTSSSSSTTTSPSVCSVSALSDC